jgi:hypothetical protein
MDIDSADEDDAARYSSNGKLDIPTDNGAPQRQSESAMDTSGDVEVVDVVCDTRSQETRSTCKTARLCWLCEYQGNRTTNEVVRFIMDGIPHMSLESLVEQTKFLLDEVNPGSDATSAEIKKHITQHMLHPRVKLALQMQEMSRMQRQVGKCCISADVETGEQTINPQAMRVYLTLCSQISGVYKLGEDKLMYNQGSMDK